MQINLCGNIFGTSGYARHTRGVFRGLLAQGVSVKLDTQLPAGWELLVTDEELRAIQQEWYPEGDVVCIALPTVWERVRTEPHRRFFGFAVWEGTHVPAHWLPCMDDVDGVFVPSTHTRDALLRSWAERQSRAGEFLTPIHIVPHGTEPEKYVPQDRPSVFTFVGNKGWAFGEKDRGGVQFLIKAFCEEFRKTEPVALRLKINPAYAPPGWNLHDELRKLGLPEDRPEILINTDPVSDRDMPLFYSGHCFVSPTMGEAFSLPCLEAMSAGLPVITTGFGGQTDYVTEETGWLVPYALVENTWDFMYEGVSWAEPDLAVLRGLLRYAFEHPVECKEKGERARVVAQGYSWAHTGDIIKSILEESV